MKTLNKVLFATLISAATTTFAAEEQKVEAAASEVQTTEVAQDATEVASASEAVAK